MASSSTKRRRLFERAEEYVFGEQRFVDFGVVLRTVRQSYADGVELLEDCPPLALIREQRLGGMLDTHLERVDFCGPSVDPVFFYCAENIEALILHGAELPRRLLLEGAMGAGKSETLVAWLYARCAELVGRGLHIGCTAPTGPRIGAITAKIFQKWPQRWWRWKERDQMLSVATDTEVQFISTHQSSKAEGSRIQAFGWAAHAGDELQDCVVEDGNIEMRGRNAPGGGKSFKRINTATPKDDTAWRNWKARIAKLPDLWHQEKMSGFASPFIAPEFWEEKKRLLDPDEYRRKVLAEDMPSRLAIYHQWDRARNLVALPDIAVDVTEAVLAHYRSMTNPHGRFVLLAGHDPGEIYNTTEVLRLYLFGELPVWMSVGEFITRQTTAGQHFAQFRAYLEREFETDFVDPDDGDRKCLVICDPHGRGESKTDYQTTYLAAQKAGIDVYSAAAQSQIVKRRPRVAMVNRLLCAATMKARLVVGIKPDGTHCAPKLVAAFESLKREHEGQVEPSRKGENDQTHPPVAVGYALWPFEQEAITEETQRAARLARGGRR